MLYLPRIFGLVWATSRLYTTAWAILLVAQGLLPAAVVFLSRLIVDALVDAVGVGTSWDGVRPVLLLGGLMAGVLLLTELFHSAIEWVRTAQSELVRDRISALIHEKSISVDIAYYESAEFHDRLDRARSDANDRSLALLEGTGSLLQNGITLVAMASMLIPYGLWLPPVLLVSTLPALFVVVRFNHRFHLWWQRSTQSRRWTKYYDTMLSSSGAASELRLFNLGGHFMSAYRGIRRRLRAEQLDMVTRQSLARIFAGSTALLISGAAMAWMVWRAFLGLVTLGDLVLFYQAFNRGQGLMRSLLSNVGQIYANSMYIGDLFTFLELEPRVVDPVRPVPIPSPLRDGIAIRQVTFRYPDSEHAALKEFDLVIPAGRTVAIVGPNGAGKSTLVKLLCRFYDPEAGAIQLDGVDIRQLSVEDLRRQITVLFQFPIRYHATAAENIALGDVGAQPSEAQVQAAAESAGVDQTILRLPQGYESLLGRLFVNGTDLSGGEWQRLALARAFVRQAPIIILDEPTSFMDSWAEIEWLDRFRELARGCTVLIITHRFTTARRADEIHVMDQGRIVESGSHAELLAQDGLYARSWTAQINAGTNPPVEASAPEPGMNGQDPGKTPSEALSQANHDLGDRTAFS
ncbi:MAG: ABC transporter ATP-binding protein [Chloroflexi bacterium]|nr:ABC transporter ATP-binding protein [Chloroflexota bacterium]